MGMDSEKIRKLILYGTGGVGFVLLFVLSVSLLKGEKSSDLTSGPTSFSPSLKNDIFSTFLNQKIEDLQSDAYLLVHIIIGSTQKDGQDLVEVHLYTPSEDPYYFPLEDTENCQLKEIDGDTEFELGSVKAYFPDPRNFVPNSEHLFLKVPSNFSNELNKATIPEWIKLQISGPPHTVYTFTPPAKHAPPRIACQQNQFWHIDAEIPVAKSFNGPNLEDVVMEITPQQKPSKPEAYFASRFDVTFYVPSGGSYTYKYKIPGLTSKEVDKVLADPILSPAVTKADDVFYFKRAHVHGSYVWQASIPTRDPHDNLTYP